MAVAFRHLHPKSIVLLPLVLLLIGCERYDPPGDLETVRMRIGSRTFTLEIADTPESRRVGLMRRDAIPRYHGMLFAFPEDDYLEFWMKNTRIPLDVIFLDSTGRVLSIRQMEPYDLSAVHSESPARYAIEINQGMADAVGLAVGDLLQIPSQARQPR